MATVLAVAPMITGFPQIASPQARPHPVNSHLGQVRFVRSSVAAMRSARNATRSAPGPTASPDPLATARSGAATPVQNVTGAVTVVGVTWAKGAVSAADLFQIRTLTGSTWSQWQSMDSDQADGPDAKEAAAATRGTNPYIVTGASKYEVRSLTTDPAAPISAKVQVVDPGASEADTAQPPSGAGSAASAATTRPGIRSRASWGANESMRRTAPSYGKVQLAFVHHTVSANSYTLGNVPAMIRGIYAYHVRSLGWNDIGYNFLVDRFGRIWEGRYGGVSRAVVGAQTLNFNAVSTGISAIGNYEVKAVPAAMTHAFKRILAWKLSLAHLPATGTVLVRGKRLQRISGHRNGFPTTCPGRYLYASLPQVRIGAAALMGSRPAAIAASSTATRYTPYKGVVLRQGSTGTAVRVLQRGMRVGIDGIFGPITRGALVTFQRQQGLPLTGVTSRLVWDRLERRDYP